MPTFIAGLIALYLLLAAIKWFGRLTPAAAAKLVRRSGLLFNVLGVALLVLRGGSSFWGPALGQAGRFASQFGGGQRRRGERVSTARSATIAMRLDLDTGTLSGEALAGRFAGRALDTLARPECLELYATCRRDDPEGATLLETYLDRRFAGWRDADEPQGEGRGRARGDAGAISRDEAYEILGLSKGADAEEIIRAHRSLMKKLHPDHGGTTALAARVNQAKDVLLNRHG